MGKSGYTYLRIFVSIVGRGVSSVSKHELTITSDDVAIQMVNQLDANSKATNSTRADHTLALKRVRWENGRIKEATDVSNFKYTGGSPFLEGAKDNLVNEFMASLARV